MYQALRRLCINHSIIDNQHINNALLFYLWPELIRQGSTIFSIETLQVEGSNSVFTLTDLIPIFLLSLWVP